MFRSDQRERRIRDRAAARIGLRAVPSLGTRMSPIPRGDEKQSQAQSGINRRRLALIPIFFSAYFALFMFLPAGTFAWKVGWIFLLILCATIALSVFVIWRINPEVIIARSQPHSGTKSWDKVLMWFWLPCIYGIIPVAAFDVAHIQKGFSTWWVFATGYFLLVIGFGIVAWAQSVNRFFESTVRIQTERGHSVISTGPYAIVRHPGYVGMILLMIGVPLCLGSLWGLLPAGLSCMMIVLRTDWEDQTLQAELDGYQHYAKHVRSRLIPRIW